MSTSRAIKPKRDDTQLSNWQSLPERAPSVERADSPVVARIGALIGLFLVVLGGMAMYWQRSAVLTPDWGFRFLSIGVCLILYHTFVERDIQFRRLYGFLGLALVIGGIALRLIAFRQGYLPHFIMYGLPALVLGLIGLVAVIRNESEVSFRTLLLNIVGAVGALIIAFAGVFALRVADFLPGEGAVLLLLGCLYICVYIGQQETGSDKAYYSGLGLGAVGLAGLAIGLVRSFWPESIFLVPNGLILMGISFLYLTISLGVCSDWPIIVLARRDLAAYFYSPIAYLVLIGLLLIGWFMFGLFVLKILQFGSQGQMFEPIIGNYIFDIFPVIVQMFVVPVLTMRLLSEERRTGSLEVLMTAPVNEISVVLGKFLACWTFYMLTWLPWWLFLVALRYMGREEFDYRPVLSFTVALAVISAGLLSMGLFFSSMTSNQIIAAVLTFVGMILHLVFYFLKFQPDIREGSAIHEVLTYVNFFDLWLNSLGGIIAPRYLMFHLSVAIFFLFATIKMLESRKWK